MRVSLGYGDRAAKFLGRSRSKQSKFGIDSAPEKQVAKEITERDNVSSAYTDEYRLWGVCEAARAHGSWKAHGTSYCTSVMHRRDVLASRILAQTALANATGVQRRWSNTQRPQSHDTDYALRGDGDGNGNDPYVDVNKDKGLGKYLSTKRRKIAKERRKSVEEALVAIASRRSTTADA